MNNTMNTNVNADTNTSIKENNGEIKINTNDFINHLVNKINELEIQNLMKDTRIEELENTVNTLQVVHQQSDTVQPKTEAKVESQNQNK